MSNQYIYKAFGLIIQSDFSIAQIPAADDSEQADVIIAHKTLSGCEMEPNLFYIKKDTISVALENIGSFRILDGSQIEVDPDPECSESHLGVYLMGTCMGAILHQRGYMPLHGSCVTDEERSILITGDSGAGKSTLAAEFLAHGWKLLTDDVAAVFDVDGVPKVQSSYPSQKLWQDSLSRYERKKDDIHSLYFSENREKYGVNVAQYFCDGCRPLSMIVRLIPTDAPSSISPIEGLAKADQLMRNTYRLFLVPPDQRQRHFQRCITMAGKIPMALVTRQNGEQCASALYDMITKHLGEINHE